MAFSSSDGSPNSSCTSSTMSDENIEESVEASFWSGLARKAITILDDPLPGIKKNDCKPGQNTPNPDALNLQKNGASLLSEAKWKQQESLVLHKGFKAIASSLSLLSDTLGNAFEEGLNFMDTRATNFTSTEPRKSSLKQNHDSISENCIPNVAKIHSNTADKVLSSSFKLERNVVSSQVKSEEKVLRSQVKLEAQPSMTKDTQLKASRDVAMAMATKAKLLLRELKSVKTDLAFTKSRCEQLEKENERLRDSIDNVDRHEEDDLVRLQLEALLAEKARLTQENASYARENHFLHEIIQYHQLRLRSKGFQDETLMSDEQSLGASAVNMDLLPLYPEEKDIIALEESVKIANQHAA